MVGETMGETLGGRWLAAKTTVMQKGPPLSCRPFRIKVTVCLMLDVYFFG